MFFESVLSGVASSMNFETYLLCLAGSLACGALLAWVHAYRNRSTANFLMTLVLLPALVQTVIMVVNGNVGTGVAVAGAFSLVRFRSVQGNSREITSVFAAMAAGLADGMGYLTLSLLMVVLFAVVTAGFTAAAANLRAKAPLRKELKITIPESLDYSGVFDDIFRGYLKNVQLLRVKTTNMGSLYELQYEIEELDETKEKEMLDAIRVRNGNLTVCCGRGKTDPETL